jgi:hypothetical protein
LTVYADTRYSCQIRASLPRTNRARYSTVPATSGKWLHSSRLSGVDAAQCRERISRRIASGIHYSFSVPCHSPGRSSMPYFLLIAFSVRPMDIHFAVCLRARRWAPALERPARRSTSRSASPACPSTPKASPARRSCPARQAAICVFRARGLGGPPARRGAPLATESTARAHRRSRGLLRAGGFPGPRLPRSSRSREGRTRSRAFIPGGVVKALAAVVACRRVDGSLNVEMGCRKPANGQGR